MRVKIMSRFRNTNPPGQGDMIWTGYQLPNGTWEVNHENSPDQGNIILDTGTSTDPQSFDIVVETDKRDSGNNPVWPQRGRILAQSSNGNVVTVSAGDNCTMPTPPAINITNRSGLNFHLIITVQPGQSASPKSVLDATVTVGDEGGGGDG